MSFSSKKNKKTEKILISLSNPDLVQELLEDAAFVQQSSKSAIVENCIFNSFFGKKETTNMFISADLYNPYEGSLQRALSNIFGYAYAGLDGARYSNLKPLVEFVQRLFFQKCANMELKHCDYEYMDRYIKYVIDDFVYTKEHQKDNIRDLNSAINMLEVIKKDLSERYNQCNGTMYELINLLLSYWDIIKSWRSTYGLLQLICSKAPWETTPDRRYKLREIIIQVCDEWTNEV